MLEEFHGIYHEDGTYTWRLLYGWGAINANVWIPSMSELVGTTGAQNTFTGCYLSAMQGMNASTEYWIDAKGGIQFQYFQQFNASGGGTKIWNACNREQSWLRTPDLGQSQHVTGVLKDGNVKTYILPTASRAVHPAAANYSHPVCHA